MDPTTIFNQLLSAAGLSASQIPSEIDLSPGNILRGIGILILVYIGARIARRLLLRAFKSTGFDPHLETLLSQLVFYGIIALGVIWVLGGFGLSVVLLSVIVGFALKDLIQNFASGLLIMGTRPFHAGDWILVNGNEGIVAEVGWRGTFIDTFDGRRVIVPNSEIISHTVTNNSLRTQLRTTIKLSVAFQNDFARVETTILDALDGIDGISPSPAPSVQIEAINGAAMNLNVYIWIFEPQNRQTRVVSDALSAIKDALAGEQMELNPPAPLVAPLNPGKLA
jgi:small-conductance mechanosensitive channel